MRRTLGASILIGLLAMLVVPIPGSGQSLDEKISGTRAELQQKEQKKNELGSEIENLGGRISTLEGQIDTLQKQEGSVQDRLDEKTMELEKLRDELEVLQERLALLQDKLVRAQKALSTRLIETYKSDEPDALTVVLESDGFADLLERARLLELVSQNDERIVSRTADLKAQVAEEEQAVAGVEQRVSDTVAQITNQRDQLAATRAGKQEAEGNLTDVRQGRKSTLAKVDEESKQLSDELTSLEAEQAAVQAQLAGTAGTVDAGPVKQGSGQLIWPVNGAISSPFGPRWGRLHAGIDIPAPAGTPIRAADAGRVAIAGPQGGYGNYTCIQHAGSLSTCYAHQNSIGVSTGQSVKQGDVIGTVGNTGASFGDHLHFETRVNGTPQDPMGYL